MKKLLTFFIFLFSTVSYAQEIEWQRTIGGQNGDYCISIIQTSDGGYMLGGHSESSISGDKTENGIGYADYWILKVDFAGNIEWQNTIGGPDVDNLYSIIQTVDGGYLLGGSSDSDWGGDKFEYSNGEEDFWIVKTDSVGNIQWQNTIGGLSYDILTSLIQTPDGGYLLGGSSYSDISGDKSEN